MSKKPASGRGHRNRQRGTENITQCSVYYYDTLGNITYTHPYVGLDASSYEHGISLMSDYNGTKNLWNPIWHFKAKGTLGDHPDHNWPDTDSPHVAFKFGDPCIRVDPADLIALIPDVPLSVIKPRAKEMLEGISSLMPASVDLGTFLVELKEGLKGIIPVLKDFKSMLGNLYLGVVFGLKSFISDLKKIAGTWSRFRKRLKWLCESNGQLVWTRRRSDKMEEPMKGWELKPPIEGHLSVADPDETPSLWHLGYRLEPVAGSLKAWWSLNMRTFFCVKGLEKFWTQVDLFSSALGLNNPVKILWNSTRMSWLAEYFVNVEPYIDKLAGNPIDIYQDSQIHIKHASLSYRVEYDVDVYHVRYWTCTGKPDTPVHIKLGTLHCSCYVRELGLPLDEEELVSCHLNANQIAILVALVESRVNWDKTRWGKWAAINFMGGVKPWLRKKLNFKDPPKSFLKYLRQRRRWRWRRPGRL